MAAAIHDISLALGADTAVYPGDPAFVRQCVCTHQADGMELSRLSMGAHVGTHVDAPAHFLPGGKTLDAFGLERFVLEAVVISVPGRPAVTADDLKGRDLTRGAAVIFQTDNSLCNRIASASFARCFTALDPSAAQLCVAQGVVMVGIDAPSIDPVEAGPLCHKILLGREILLLEGLDLRGVSPGRYRLICPPLKICRAEGAPVRALLLRP
jgi:arylformamidase